MHLQELDLDALVAASLAELGTETAESPVPCLIELTRRGTRDVFDRAAALTKSALVAERELGVRILRELGGLPRPFATEAIPLLLSMLANEASPDVLRWVVSAMGYQHIGGRTTDSGVLRAVLEHANHEHASVRFAVAAALPSLVGDGCPDGAAVATLVRLSSDEDADTRYYALAALVDDLHLEHDDAVKRALQHATTDSDDQIRRLALRALGRGLAE